MENIIDYANTCTSSIDETGFNYEADGLIFAKLSSMDFSGLGIDYPATEKMTIEDIWKLVEQEEKSELKDRNISGNNKKLLEAIANNPRYKDLELGNYVKNPCSLGTEGFEATNVGDPSVEQFAALTVSFEDENGKTVNYVSYQPTLAKEDNGWIEDCDMLYYTETQAQKDSATYLNLVADRTEGDLIVGGHSKGANDAEYAYLFCDQDTAERVVAACSYDGAGMGKETIAMSDRYDQWTEVLGNGACMFPQDTIVSQILTGNTPSNTYVVHSIPIFNSDFISNYLKNPLSGMLEHDPFTWEMEDGKFVADEQSDLSKGINNILDNFVDNLPPSQRRYALQLFRAVFKLDPASGLVGSITNWNYVKLFSILGILGADFIETSADTFTVLLCYLGARTEKGTEWIEDKLKTGIENIDGIIDDAKNWLDEKVDEGKNKIREAQENLQSIKNGLINELNNIIGPIIGDGTSGKNYVWDWFSENIVHSAESVTGTGIIQLTPSVLLDQATQMDNLKSDYAAHFSNFKSVLNSVNSNWSTGLAHNFAGKIITAGRSFDNITESLYQGAEVARNCASGFESIDRELAKCVQQN